MGAGCSSGATAAVRERGKVAESSPVDLTVSKSFPLGAGDHQRIVVSAAEEPAPPTSLKEAWSPPSAPSEASSTASVFTPGSLAQTESSAKFSITHSTGETTLESTVEVPDPADVGDDMERKVCWIRGSFHIRDRTEPLVRRRRPELANRRPRSLSIAETAPDTEGDAFEEDSGASDLFQRATKTTPGFAGQVSTGAYFLSLAHDVNEATLQRLAPTAAPPVPLELPALLFIDWDDTLFPTSWSHRTFAEPGEELRGAATAAAALLRAARQAGEVVIVTLATEQWIEDCLVRADCDAFSAEVARVRIIYARQIQENIAVWPRQNEPPRAAQNFGVLLGSLTWEPELRAQLVTAKMAAIRSATPDGCRQVISIGDSTLERWAVHDLPFADEGLAGVLVKTIKFQEELSCGALSELLQTTTSLLSLFVRLNVQMDVDLSSDDSLFPMDLQLAMQTASRPADVQEPSSPLSPSANGSPSPLSKRRRKSRMSHEL
jgi:hypothetical protein